MMIHCWYRHEGRPEYGVWMHWNSMPLQRGRHSFITSTPWFWKTATLWHQIWTWRNGFSSLKMLCSWWERANIWCQMPFRFLKSLIWAGKEFKVKKDFQPCFAEQKALGGTRNRSASRGNLDAHPWKLIDLKMWRSKWATNPGSCENILLLIHTATGGPNWAGSFSSPYPTCPSCYWKERDDGTPRP